MTATETTTRPEVNIEAIPKDLREHTHWVVWDYEMRDGEPTKNPYNPRTGKKAKVNDSRTWGTLPEALEAFEIGDWGGLGFVFSSGDPYCGIDLDNCLVDGEIEPWAQEIIASFQTKYVEISPSGTGVHLITLGDVDKGRSRWIDVIVDGEIVKRKVEIYSTRRFFTMSGRAI